VGGDADVDYVGNGSCYLLALPAGGALVLAGLRADSFSQVLDTPAREAFLISVTLIQEASRTRIAAGRKAVGNVWEDQFFVYLLELSEIEVAGGVRRSCRVR
jgi:hypothetical protein